jgi:hypothetical protein
MAQNCRSGVALSIMDGFLAAPTLAKDLTLVTRNIKDFMSFSLPLQIQTYPGYTLSPSGLPLESRHSRCATTTFADSGSPMCSHL